MIVKQVKQFYVAVSNSKMYIGLYDPHTGVEGPVGVTPGYRNWLLLFLFNLFCFEKSYWELYLNQCNLFSLCRIEVAIPKKKLSMPPPLFLIVN